MAAKPLNPTLSPEEQRHAEIIYRSVVDYFACKGIADTQKIFNRALSSFASSDEFQSLLGDNPDRQDRAAVLGVVSDAFFLITDSFNFIPKENQIKCL